MSSSQAQSTKVAYKTLEAITPDYFFQRTARLNALNMQFNESDGIPQRQKLSPRQLEEFTNGQVICDKKSGCIHLGECCIIIGLDHRYCKYHSI